MFGVDTCMTLNFKHQERRIYKEATEEQATQC